MTIGNLKEAIEILSKYTEAGLEAPVNGADHDMFYIATTSEPLSSESLERLKELGVYIDEQTCYKDCKYLNWFIFA